MGFARAAAAAALASAATGGTGPSLRDVTPEATEAVCEKPVVIKRILPHLIAVSDAATLQRLAERTIRQGFGPILAPMIQVENGAEMAFASTAPLHQLRFDVRW